MSVLRNQYYSSIMMSVAVVISHDPEKGYQASHNLKPDRKFSIKPLVQLFIRPGQ
jgi:hypothetical protein